MPIVEMEHVGSLSDSVAQGLAPRLADAIAEVLGSGPQGTWVKLRHLPTSDYAENGGGPAPGVSPVFVSVLQSTLPTGDTLAAQTKQLADTIAALYQRPVENVHIVYQAAGRGRVAFGGVMIE